MSESEKFLALMGQGPRRIPHWEHWSCPDAETYLTGIDYYDHPRLCRQRMKELYPELELAIPPTDEPGRGPDPRGESETPTMPPARRFAGATGKAGTGTWGKHFKTRRGRALPSRRWHMATSPICPWWSPGLLRRGEALPRCTAKRYPAEWGDKAPEGSAADASAFYNTMFMWPLLTFGWELFLERCLDPRFERIMDEFAEINRRVFRAFARLPVNFVICHDDIVTTRGPVCSPAWMHKYIFPRYEEFWGMLQGGGQAR